MKRKFPNNGKEPNVMSKQLLLSRMEKVNDCWEWIGYRNAQRYGRIMIQRRSYSIHRLAAHLWKGFDLESDLIVCHHCDNPPCFNPEHLFIGTHLDNALDKSRKGRVVAMPEETSPVSKLKRRDVEEILHLIDSGLEQKRIAEMFNVSPCHISELKRGFYWKETWEKYHASKRNSDLR